MVEYEKKNSSGVAKAALTTGIVGATLGVLNGAGGLFGISRTPFVGAGVSADPTGGFVTDKDMCLIREISAKDAVISGFQAEKYADNKVTAALVPVYAELGKQKDDICDLKAALAMESERRYCGDEKLQTYVDGNFIKAEKSLNSKRINYHGCEPVIRPIHNHCCDDGCN